MYTCARPILVVMLYEQEAGVGQRGGVCGQRQQVELALVLGPPRARAQQQRHVHLLHLASCRYG